MKHPALPFDKATPINNGDVMEKVSGTGAVACSAGAGTGGAGTTAGLGAGAGVGSGAQVPGVIARFGALKLYGDHVAQSTPKHFKTLALPGIEYCRWERHRYIGLAALGILCGSAALGILVATWGDGRAYWIPVWVLLAGVSIALFTAYIRMSSGVMTIRGMFGYIVETNGSRRAAVDFLKGLMAARQALSVAQDVEIARAVAGGAGSSDLAGGTHAGRAHAAEPTSHLEPIVTETPDGTTATFPTPTKATA